MKRQFLYLTAKYFNKAYFILSFLALLSGGIIYLLFRTTDSVFFKWIGISENKSWIINVRDYTLKVGSSFPDWIVNSLPDGLWAFAYALLITGIWWRTNSNLKYVWMSSIPLLVIGFEFLQFFGIIAGTFSWTDIAFGTAGIISGIIVGIK